LRKMHYGHLRCVLRAPPRTGSIYRNGHLNTAPRNPALKAETGCDLGVLRKQGAGHRTAESQYAQKAM
jgi:hypothetical protein